MILNQFPKGFQKQPFCFRTNGREVDKEGLWNGAEEVPAWPEPLCCDSIMEISAFLHSQRSFTIWLFIFTFRGESSVSPENTQSDCGSGERLFSFPVKHLLLGMESGLHPFYINGWYMQIGFQRSMWWQDESPPFAQAGSLRDLMNGTIELIWFSSLYKIPDKM